MTPMDDDVAERDEIERRVSKLEGELAAGKVRDAERARENATLARKLAEAKSESALLRADIAALTPKPVPPPRRPVERQTTVTHPIAVSSIAQPSDAEFRQLRAICKKTYPMWCDSTGFVFGLARYPDREACDAEWFSQFKRAFFAISNMCRIDRPDAKRYLSAHIDMCADFLARVRQPNELRAGPFLMACFAAGDVPIGGVGLDGQSISVGLAEHIGKAASADAWRAILSSGRLPNQVRVHTPMAPASPSRGLSSETVRLGSFVACSSTFRATDHGAR